MTGFTRQDFRRIEYTAALTVAAFAALAVAASAWAGGEEVLKHFGRLTPPLVGALLGLSLINYAARALRWHLYIRRLGLGVPFRTSALQFVAGFALTTTPGKVGEALRLWLMERRNGVPYARSIPLLFADRIIDLLAMGILALVGLLALSAPSGLYVLGAGATAGVLALTMRPWAALRAVGLGYRVVGRRPRLFAGMRGAIRRTAELFAPKVLGAAMLLTILGWLAECAALALVLRALDADIGALGAILTFTVAMLAGAATLLPGGLGGTEATMVALLALQGVGLEAAIPATAIIRASTLWFAVLLGFAALSPALHQARRVAA